MWTILIFLGISAGNRVVRNRYEQEGRVAPFAVRHWITWTLIKMVALLTALAVVLVSINEIMVHWHTWGPWVAIPTAIYLFVLFVRSRINDDRGHRERALANRQRIDGEQAANQTYIEGKLATRRPYVDGEQAAQRPYIDYTNVADEARRAASTRHF